MPPAPDHLDPGALESSLRLAQALHRAAIELGPLMGDGRGRAGAHRQARGSWFGTLAERFDRRVDHELALADEIRAGLMEEAGAWARFWADATTANQERVHRLAMAEHHRAVAEHERRLADHQRLAAADPGAAATLGPPAPPQAPRPPDPVPVPRLGGDGPGIR